MGKIRGWKVRKKNSVATMWIRTSEAKSTSAAKFVDVVEDRELSQNPWVLFVSDYSGDIASSKYDLLRYSTRKNAEQAARTFMRAHPNG